MDLSDQVQTFLEGISLTDLVERQDIREESEQQQLKSKGREQEDDQLVASNI